MEEDKLDPDDAIVTFRREEHMLFGQQLLAIASVVPIIPCLLIAIRLYKIRSIQLSIVLGDTK
jgi:hypothetical protein